MPSQLPIPFAPSPEDTDASSRPDALAPEDFYYEGPYIVFTAAYHLKRGYCCNSDCRHCPYCGSDEPIPPPA